jgi:hypothetical protein
MVVALAGPVADARYRRTSLAATLAEDGAKDWGRVVRTSRVCFRSAEASARRAAVERTRAIVQSEAGWRAIERVADLLVERGTLAEDDFRGVEEVGMLSGLGDGLFPKETSA